MTNTVTWEEWLSGRAKRREVAFAITGGPVFRKNGPDDDVLKQWNGRREIDFRRSKRSGPTNA